jgi:hypothetical protein
MSGQVSTILEPLADAIDDLDLPVDSGALTEAFAVADRLNAKLLEAVGSMTPPSCGATTAPPP